MIEGQEPVSGRIVSVERGRQYPPEPQPSRSIQVGSEPIEAADPAGIDVIEA
jgi:hypothetical protein